MVDIQFKVQSVSQPAFAHKFSFYFLVSVLPPPIGKSTAQDCIPAAPVVGKYYRTIIGAHCGCRVKTGAEETERT